MRLKLKGVYQSHKKLRNGRLVTYHFLRGFGALKPLPDDEGEDFSFGSPAFMRSYQAAIAAPRKQRVEGTLQQVIDGYRDSQSFKRLAPRTQKDYLEHLDKIAATKLAGVKVELATYPLSAIDDPRIRRDLLGWRDKMAETSPRQADARFGVLRIILEWARDRGMIANNHATRPKKVYKADRADKLWLPEHIEAFRAVADEPLKLALDLALWTGQRQGDLLKLCWTSYKDGRLTFRQGKRKRKIDMPVVGELRARLDSMKPVAATIMTTAAGKPWGKINFQHKWRAATLAAGLDGLHFHDLRGTTCTKLADARCTPSEIAAMLGWTVQTVNAMLDRYQAMTAAQSDNAVAKLEAKAVNDSFSA